MCRWRVDEGLGLLSRKQVAVDRALVDLGERVVKAFAVAERLVDGWVEPVEEPELELVVALEQVLQLGE